MKLIRTNSEHFAFVNLVSQLNKYLKTVDGNDHDFYMQYNNIDTLNHVVLGFFKDVPVACGAFKTYNEKSVEIKRMFTLPEYRGQQLASKILNELEIWATELGFKSCILETGKRQVEAVKFYKKNNYNIIENFDPYIDVENSICFEKKLSYAKR